MLTNNKLDWLLDIQPEALMFDSEEWDRVALRKTMADFDYYLIKQKGIFVDQLVHDEFALADFTILKMDFYLATLDAVIKSISNLTWVNQAVSGEIKLKFLDKSQLTDIARILIQQGLEISVYELEAYQMVFLDFLVQFNIQKVGDVTEEVACRVLSTYLDGFNVASYGYSDCVQFTPGTFFKIFLDWFQTESGVDLRPLGLQSFEDVSEELLFAIASDKLKKEGIVLYDYQILSFDDFTGENLAQIMENNSNTWFSSGQIEAVQQNFPVLKMQLQKAVDQAQANLVMFQEVFGNSSVGDSALACYASLAITTTATLISLAF